MDNVVVVYNEYALEAREAINIAIVAFSAVLCVLITRFIVLSYMTIKEFGMVSYGNLSWVVRLNVGLLFIFLGEFLRSATILIVLHTEGAKGTYLSEVVPLMFCLALIVIGGVCAIRVMTPKRWGQWAWVVSLTIVIGLIVANWFWF